MNPGEKMSNWFLKNFMIPYDAWVEFQIGEYNGTGTFGLLDEHQPLRLRILRNMRVCNSFGYKVHKEIQRLKRQNLTRGR